MLQGVHLRNTVPEQARTSHSGMTSCFCARRQPVPLAGCAHLAQLGRSGCEAPNRGTLPALRIVADSILLTSSRFHHIKPSAAAGAVLPCILTRFRAELHKLSGGRGSAPATSGRARYRQLSTRPSPGLGVLGRRCRAAGSTRAQLRAGVVSEHAACRHGAVHDSWRLRPRTTCSAKAVTTA